MYKPVYIVRIVSALLLLVFILGVTPKRFLHDLFAKHTDTISKNNDLPFRLTTSGYNCDCDNLVAESNFVNDLHTFSFPLFSAFSSYIFKNISFSSISNIYSPLRGPPVMI